jgi:hypothetical protein
MELVPKQVVMHQINVVQIQIVANTKIVTKMTLAYLWQVEP